MKIIFLTLISCTMFAARSNSQELNGVTFGFGAGYSRVFNSIYDYSLTTDTSHMLKLQELTKGNFVISSVLTIKLGKLALDDEHKFINAKTNKAALTRERYTFNLALNLLEIKSDNISFNKGIDGGVGFGYLITSNVHVALFFDVFKQRQLRDYIISSYENKRIPNGIGYYTALDPNDNNLFFNKTFTGLSLKIIMSIANSKPSN